MAFPKLLQKLFQNNGAGDKLNKSIVPDLDYLPKSGGTVNGSVTINGTTVPVSGSTETYKEGIKFGWGSEISQSRPNGLDIWAKRGDATTVMALYGEKKDGDTTGNTPGIYLRAGDGTNTKSMKLSATKGLAADVHLLTRPAGEKVMEIIGADNDGCISLIPGNTGQFSAKKSATLFLTSTDFTGLIIPAGSFYLSAMDATTGVKSLAGSPDGTLTWCGRSLTGGLTVVAESYGANSWYRKYSDGWIEQGGIFFYSTSTWPSNNNRVTLAIPFSTAVYGYAIGGPASATGSYDTGGDSGNTYYATVSFAGVNKTQVLFSVSQEDYSANATLSIPVVAWGK